MRRHVSRVEPMRALALLAALALIAAFTSVLYGLVDVAGGTAEFGVLVGLSLVGATALAGVVRPRHALMLAATVLAGGMAWYLSSLPYTPQVFPIIQSNIELLSGQSIHQIRRSSVWALGVAPAPIFVTWYFALRRWYGAALLVGGAMLGFVVLTGDANLAITLVGVVGGTALLAFGDLDRHDGTATGAEYVAISLAVMVAIPLVVTVVPAGAGSPLSLVEGETQTLESSLLDSNSQFTVEGAIELSPNVRFVVESNQGRYWKANSYDRYTGEGWVRTGGTTPLAEGSLEYPQGPREVVSQRVEVRSRLTSLPAAWRPVGVDREIADRVSVTDNGDLTLSGSLSAGDTYRVTSAVPASFEALTSASGGAYPAAIRERYLQVPESTPDRVAERTRAITQNATTPYETAVVIERWLEAHREYSLDVERPRENIADSFLFEMDHGYCTYYATTMVVMLRSEGVPARLASGYTTGQQVDNGTWVVRGLDAHSWVEVYFNDLGWVAFDPTPSAPRETAEQRRIESARQNNVSTVDTAESRNVTDAPETSESGSATTGPAGSPESTDLSDVENQSFGLSALGVRASERGSDDEEGGGGQLPTREEWVLGGVLLVGLAAGVRRTGVDRWVEDSVRIRFQRRVDPVTDVKRATERAEILLGRRNRPRRKGETVRQFVERVDAPPPARRLVTIYERVHYGGEADPALADEALGLVAELREQDAGARRSRGPFR